MNPAARKRSRGDQSRYEGNSLDIAIEKALEWSDKEQFDEGYWCGPLECNSCLEAEWILFMHIMNMKDHPKLPGLVQCLLNEQRPDGSWDIYYGAPMGDINTTVECYMALRSAGLDPEDDVLKRAREWILSHGGLREIRVFTKYWLAMIGEWPWEKTPTLIPELIWLPSWMPFNIYDFSSWARATLVPLCLLCCHRPVVPLPEDKRMDELFPEGRENFDFSLQRKAGLISWESVFHGFDRFFGTLYYHSPVKPFREVARAQCRDWIIAHQDADGGWGGIQPPWIYSIMALHFDGYSMTHPVMAKGLSTIDSHWSYERDGGTYIQACMSPVWDTLLTMLAQEDCGETIDSRPPMRLALEWVLKKRVFVGGDWQVHVRNVQPGGWAFEHENAAYPDVDDTSVAVIVLSRIREYLKTNQGDPDLIAKVEHSVSRAVHWMMGFQCRAGGWAAFDKDNDSEWVCKIPFCDFGEVLDPPSVDVTAHVLESLGLNGFTRNDPEVARAIAFIKSEQEDEGSWFGRWGVNHIYGTAAVLPGLEGVGEDMTQPYIRKAADWLVSKQNDDGGWGETCASYMDDHLRGVGDSTASQTGWGIMALVAMKSPDYNDAILKAVAWLEKTQRKDGTWDEPQYTGTGFPGYGVGHRVELRKQGDLHQGNELARGFMINYNLYRHYFPLMAMGRARRHLSGS